MARIYRKFRSLLKDQSGAVTVDWVVLTALMVSLATLGVASIGGAASTVGDWIVEDITESE